MAATQLLRIFSLIAVYCSAAENEFATNEETKLSNLLADVAYVNEKGTSADFAMFVTRLSPLFYESVNGAVQMLAAIISVKSCTSDHLRKLRDHTTTVAACATEGTAARRKRQGDEIDGPLEPESDVENVANEFEEAICVANETKLATRTVAMRLQKIADSIQAPTRMATHARLQQKARLAINALDALLPPQDKVLKDIKMLVDAADQREEVVVQVAGNVQQLDSRAKNRKAFTGQGLAKLRKDLRAAGPKLRISRLGGSGGNRLRKSNPKFRKSLGLGLGGSGRRSGSEIAGKRRKRDVQATGTGEREEEVSRKKRSQTDDELQIADFDNLDKITNLAYQVPQLAADMIATAQVTLLAETKGVTATTPLAAVIPDATVAPSTAGNGISREWKDLEHNIDILSEALTSQAGQVRAEFRSSVRSMVGALSAVKSLVEQLNMRLDDNLDEAPRADLLRGSNEAGQSCYTKLVSKMEDPELGMDIIFNEDITTNADTKKKLKQLLAVLGDDHTGAKACYDRYRLHYSKTSTNIFKNFQQRFERQFPDRHGWHDRKALAFLDGADDLESLIIVQASQLLMFETLRQGAARLNETLYANATQEAGRKAAPADATAKPVDEAMAAEKALDTQIAVIREVDVQFMETFKPCRMELHLKEAADKLRLVCNKVPAHQSIKRVCKNGDVRSKRESDKSDLACLPALHYYVATLCVFNCLIEDETVSESRFPPVVCGPNRGWNYKVNASLVQACTMETIGLGLSDEEIDDFGETDGSGGKNRAPSDANVIDDVF